MSRTESSVRIDAEGRIQLPPEVREKLGLEVGQQVELTTEDGTLVVRTARETGDATEDGLDDIHARRHRRAIEQRAERGTETEERNEQHRE
jgi:AbrB family looped-hinge helix DNA binding protein